MEQYLKINQPTVKELDQALNQAIGGQSITQWQQTFIQSTIQTITQEKRLYRTYGIYWWLIKSEIIKSGYHGFGTTVSDFFVEHMTYNDTTHNLIASWLEHNHTMQIGMIYSNRHESVLETGRIIRYQVVDDQMEGH